MSISLQPKTSPRMEESNHHSTSSKISHSVMKRLRKLRKNRMTIAKNRALRPLETGIKLEKLSEVIDLPENSRHIQMMMANASAMFDPNG